jgi:type IV pilus assembly protein PilY1
MVGSGDREKPLLSATQDHFFQIFDRKTTAGAPATATPIVWSVLTASSTVASASSEGCYVALAQGEKVVNAAASIGGDTYFGTNRPGSAASGNSCSAGLGIARSYAMPLFCVTPTSAVLVGGGLPPSPVTGIVNVLMPDGTTRQKSFVIGAPNPQHSSIGVGEPTKPTGLPRTRRYWYQESPR